MEQNIFTFDWDVGNATKSYLKHGINKDETESVFIDEDRLVILVGLFHHENRYICIGYSKLNRLIAVIYTLKK